ncbi:lysophospholipid acyltransferase family protein [Adhaeretor mobilis]|uniref:DUF374 domain-containing protein n=1 Tax=Adhaeretor mobilis TaxID=1930276 RepID=A0A517N040_9BACT|nr:lysophospholipid acyltransferase family protein [Adhaeretor mobilis]QDT00509.1 hypothetical protein HG15A2_38470 [Adhaeretor mobilis]
MSKKNKTAGPSLPVRWGGMLASLGIRGWMSTMDYRAIFQDPRVDAIHPAEKPRIYVFWHEYILIPLYLRGNCNLSMLLSKHRDADILDRVAGHMGFHCVRGSTYNGATAALLELSRRGQSMHLTITPDGPRGPRRELAQGAVFLASRMQMPIVALGFGSDRPWRAGSWDKFAVPRPFSRVRAIISPEIHIPAGLDRPALEQQRLGVERRLQELTTEAENWAASGERRAGETVAKRQGLIKQTNSHSIDGHFQKFPAEYSEPSEKFRKAG